MKKYRICHDAFHCLISGKREDPGVIRPSSCLTALHRVCLPLAVLIAMPVAVADTGLASDNFHATKTYAGVIQVEAENLSLDTYLVEASAFSSGGQVISLRGAGSNHGVGSGTFRGADGDYLITVNYMDENDGLSSLQFEAKGITVDSWTLDQRLGNPSPDPDILTARTFGPVHLEQGDTYSIVGDKDGNEETRVDFIQFIPANGIYQAEDAVYSSHFSVRTGNRGFSDRGYVDALRDGFIEWSVHVPDNGDYSLDFRYAFGANGNPQGKRPLNIFANGKLVAKELPFKTTLIYSRWQNQTAIARLSSGWNTIRAETPPAPAGTDNLMANIDYLSVSKASYLNARGSSAPEPDAYHPEFGESGYSDSYYGRVDPRGERSTLNKWLVKNRFKQFPHLVVSAEYINAYDLGFGRKMHCLESACYVENFLNPGTGNEKFAATVTMEKLPRGLIAFGVYDPDEKRINQIGLDSEGAKSVPESCYACHGGGSHAGAPQKGVQYLPWDIDLLEEWPGHGTLESQAENFRKLNLIASKAADRFDNKKTEITTLIDSWYGGNPVSGSVFNSSPFHQIAGQKLVPKDKSKESWFTDATGYRDTAVISERRDRYFDERSLYDNIYTSYCRSCHVAQRSRTDWSNALPFNIAAYRRVCDTPTVNQTMPHAELTDDRFSNELHQFVHGDSSTAREILCSEPPPVTPALISAGEAAFSGCAGCHDAGMPASSKEGGDISCSTQVRDDLEIINNRMSGLTLSGKQVTEITAYLNSFDQCNL
ncbi:MAG: hypothetical protein V3U76_06580 [Granulosicoccus sp.]